MASRPLGPDSYALGLCLRALVIASLVIGVVATAVIWQFYATALLLAGAAFLAFLDLRSTVIRADRSFRALMESLAMGEFDRAEMSPSTHPSYNQAMDRAVDAMVKERAQRQGRIDRLQTLADSVPAALLIIAPSGRVQLGNAAAQRLAGEDAVRLEDVKAIGPQAAARIAMIAPGGREIVRLADGRQMLGSVLRFRQPGAPPERLVALQDVAVELDAVEVKAWQDLVRVLAHEMLNSLTPITALAESLQRCTGLDADTAASIEVIARRSSGLRDFVDRYRKVAEMPQPDCQSMELGAFAADLERLVRPAMVISQVEFQCAVDPPALTVEADRQLVEQAVINLVKNACDAVAGQAEPRVSVTCTGVGERVEIAVADNGPGLAPDALDKLFVPFFTTKLGGSGIGLTLARQIALAHHGQLEATPAVPQGAVFTLTLPAVQPHPNAAPARPLSREAPAAAGTA